MTLPHFERCAVPVIACGPGWLTADKPSGMSIHNNPGSDLQSVLQLYLESTPKAASTVHYTVHYGLHPAHRLDRATSGIVLLGCSKTVLDDLAHQFAIGAVTKRYVALVHGAVQATGDWHSWRWPLTPKAAGRRSPQGRGRRRPCETRYRVMAHSRHYSLLECQLLTGRTHQIRRHAVLAGHPLAGDSRYGSARACRYLEAHHNFTRLGLHAAALTFRLPDEEAPRQYESQGLPVSIRQLIEQDADYRVKN